MTWDEIATMTIEIGKKLLSQEELDGYEDSGAGLEEPILKNNEGCIDEENSWEPLTLASTVGNNPVSASPEVMLNRMMPGGDLGHGNTGGGSTNGGGTSAPSPNAASVPVQLQQPGSDQAVWSALKAAVARVGAAAISHEFSKRMLKGQSNVGGDESKAKDFRDQALESQNLQVFVGVVKGDTKLKVFHSMVEYNENFHQQSQW